MRNVSFVLTGAAALGLALSGLVMPSDVSAKEFYAGKTIKILIGRGPGSGTDATVRSFAKHWAKHIPGKPKIIPQNMKGVPTWNFIYEKAKPNGMTVAFSPYNPIPGMLKQKGFRAVFAKMEFLGGFVNPPMLYARIPKVTTNGATLKVNGALYGGQRPALRFDLLGRITLDLLGAEYRYTTGFGGGKKGLNAMRRSEVDLQTVGLNLYRLSIERALINTGKAAPLYYYTFPQAPNIASKIFGDIPSFSERYKQIKGKAPSGEKYDVYKWMGKTLNGLSYAAFLPPGTDQKAMAILLKAFKATAKDPAYRAEQKKMFGFNLPYVTKKGGEDVINTMTNAPQKYKTFMANYIKAGAKHNRKKKKKK